MIIHYYTADVKRRGRLNIKINVNTGENMDQRTLDAPGRLRGHSLHLENREMLTVTGVRDVMSFNEQEIHLATDVGELHVDGEGLHVVRLDLEDGQAVLAGRVEALEYSEPREERGLFGRLFG